MTIPQGRPRDEPGPAASSPLFRSASAGPCWAVNAGPLVDKSGWNSPRPWTDVLDVAATKPTGAAGGPPAIPAARVPLRSALFRRGGAAAGGRRPRNAPAAVPARLRADALSVRQHTALGRAGGARPRFAAIHGCAFESRARPSRRSTGAQPRLAARASALYRAGARSGELHRPEAIQEIMGSAKLAAAGSEHRLGHQYYFNTERGRAGLTENRRDLARLLWKLWSPNWQFQLTRRRRDRCTFLRQPRLRRRRDSVSLPLAICQDAWRSRAAGHRC